MSESCSVCKKTKAEKKCEICEAFVCRNCEHFVPESTFSFLTKVPAELQHARYCSPCYEEHVAPQLNDYEQKMGLAKGVYVFFKSQRKPLPIIKRSKEMLKVEKCPDRDETIMRLAFQAVEKGFNVILETDVTSKKVRNEGYEKQVWSGTAFGALGDVEKLEKYDRG